MIKYSLEEVARYAYIDYESDGSLREILDKREHVKHPIVFLTAVGGMALGTLNGCYSLMESSAYYGIKDDIQHEMIISTGIGLSVLGLGAILQLMRGKRKTNEIYKFSRINRLVVKYGPRALERKVVRKLI